MCFTHVQYGGGIVAVWLLFVTLLVWDSTSEAQTWFLHCQYLLLCVGLCRGHSFGPETDNMILVNFTCLCVCQCVSDLVHLMVRLEFTNRVCY